MSGNNPRSGGASNLSELEKTVLENTQFEPDEGADDAEFTSDNDRSEGPEVDASAREDEGGAEDEGAEDQRREVATREQQQRRDVTHTGNLQRDSRGNIIERGTTVDQRGNVLGSDGRIIAKAGTERRFYDERNKARFDALTVRANAERIRGDLDRRLRRAIEIGTEALTRLRTQSEADVGGKLGLAPAEQVEALTLFAEGKRDPTALLKKLLTRAATSGIDVTKLGLQGGVDPASLASIVQDAINNAVKPLKERSEADAQTQQQEAEYQQRLHSTQEMVQDHFKQNPDMLQFAPVYAEILNSPDPVLNRMTLEEIRLRILLNLRQKGQSPQRQQRRGLPNGRRRPANGRAEESEVAPVSTSYDDIIRDALRGN